MTDLAAPVQPRSGYLLNGRFDAAFLLLPMALAFAAAGLVISDQQLFPFLFALDMWLLGYHHVVATFTRLCFDRVSVGQHQFLLFWLPPIVLSATLVVGFAIGIWVIATVYLYWQWFHYARQSWGITQIYRRKAGRPIGEPEWFAKLAFYLVPVWGILQRSAEQPVSFIGLEIYTFPVPLLVAHAVGACACVALIAWAVLRVRMWLRGDLPVAQTLYLLSHFGIFAVAYILIDDITYGWIAINIWHNVQYLMFVWLFNNQKFSKGVDARARLISHLSQTRNIIIYFAVTLGITLVAYKGIQFFLGSVLTVGVPLILIYQTINFHHYVVDAVIWKARKKSIQTALSLPQG